MSEGGDGSPSKRRDENGRISEESMRVLEQESRGKNGYEGQREAKERRQKNNKRNENPSPYSHLLLLFFSPPSSAMGRFGKSTRKSRTRPRRSGDMMSLKSQKEIKCLSKVAL